MRILIGTIALACTLAVAGAAQAQNRMFGIKGGITLASADVEDVSGTFDADNRTGWGVGAFLTLGAGVFSVQPEVNFVENGFDVATPLGTSEVKLRYFVPAVLLRAGLPLPLVRPGIFGGVGIGFAAGCKIDGTACEDAPLAFDSKATDPTGIFGADVDVKVGSSTSLRADVRYLVGFSDIREASDVWTEIKNRAWAVSAGLAFRF